MSIRPLITAEDVFPALEALAADAQSELLMSFRIFDPETRLTRPEFRERGLETWADLLAIVAARGVTIRLIIADFDPLFAQTLHRNAWRSASGFADRLEGDVQVLCAAHGHETGAMWRMIFAHKIREKMKGLRDEDPTKLTPIQREVLERGRTRLRPVTIHQKFAVADGTKAVIGGLDIDARRFDDKSHDRAPEQTWHDVSVEVTGGFCAALGCHFRDTWNNALDGDGRSLANRAERFDTRTRVQAPSDMRLVRTVSRPKSGFFRLAPESVHTEHSEEMIRAVNAAKRSIYIETQFLRDADLADALANAGVRNPALELVIIVPSEPDRILYDGDEGPTAKHAQALQVKAVNRLMAVYGERLAMLSPAKPERAAPEVAKPLEGGGPIYVHAKVTLIDDDFGLIGSANLNGRSFRWDTEASVLFSDRDAVQRTRRKLAEKWLGAHLSEDYDVSRADVWRKAALANAARDPDARDGFLLPYPITRNRAFAQRFFFIPDDMF